MVNLNKQYKKSEVKVIIKSYKTIYLNYFPKLSNFLIKSRFPSSYIIYPGTEE